MLEEMKVAIVGYAVENQAVLRYWQQKGAEITVCDQDEKVKVPDDVATRLGAQYLDGLDEFDVIVRTVGMHPKLIIEKNAGVEAKITTAINIFFEECKKPIIGVTGTKGKGTASTLIAKILEAAGKKVLLGGNIGVPVLDLLPKTKDVDYAVVELSSFQLIDMNHSPHIAVCLMVAPEHLNWHDEMDEYISAKQRLFLHQTPEDRTVYNRNNAHSTEVASISLGAKVSYEVPGPGALATSHEGAYVESDTIYMNDVPVCKISDVALLGRHNLDNVCAAIATVWEVILHDVDAIKQVVSTFKGLEHRLELVRELDGVRYYDDSFGTTPETAIVAIQAFEKPKIVILGGSEKNSDYADLAQAVASHNVKAVVLIGEMGPKIHDALIAAGYTNIVDGGQTMDAIVAAAKSQAVQGDIVLLSTACASFDLFKDYKDRGEQFKRSVLALS